MAVLDASVLSTKSLREERFPKPELEISFTPLKPDRVNVRKPGEEGSVTIKLRRTARKRKSPELQVCRNLVLKFCCRFGHGLLQKLILQSFR